MPAMSPSRRLFAAMMMPIERAIADNQRYSLPPTDDAAPDGAAHRFFDG